MLWPGTLLPRAAVGIKYVDGSNLTTHLTVMLPEPRAIVFEGCVPNGFEIGVDRGKILAMLLGGYRRQS